MLSPHFDYSEFGRWTDLFNHLTAAEHLHIIGDDSDSDSDGDSDSTFHDKSDGADENRAVSDELYMEVVREVEKGREVFNTCADPHPPAYYIRLRALPSNFLWVFPHAWHCRRRAWVFSTAAALRIRRQASC